MKGGPEGLLLLFLPRSVYELLQASHELFANLRRKYDQRPGYFDRSIQIFKFKIFVSVQFSVVLWGKPCQFINIWKARTRISQELVYRNGGKIWTATWLSSSKHSNFQVQTFVQFGFTNFYTFLWMLIRLRLFENLFIKLVEIWTATWLFSSFPSLNFFTAQIQYSYSHQLSLDSSRPKLNG